MQPEHYLMRKKPEPMAVILINPKTQDTRFELTKMDPTLYRDVSGLKEGEVSYPLVEEDQTGKKKYKLITVTNRINEHIADYAKDYIKIKSYSPERKTNQRNRKMVQ